jgi:hypothetical protein
MLRPFPGLLTFGLAVDRGIPGPIRVSMFNARKRHLHGSLRRTEDVLDLGDRPILEVEEDGASVTTTIAGVRMGQGYGRGLTAVVGAPPRTAPGSYGRPPNCQSWISTVAYSPASP